jgi:hypothetical protein
MLIIQFFIQRVYYLQVPYQSKKNEFYLSYLFFRAKSFIYSLKVWNNLPCMVKMTHNEITLTPLDSASEICHGLTHYELIYLVM